MSNGHPSLAQGGREVAKVLLHAVARTLRELRRRERSLAEDHLRAARRGRLERDADGHVVGRLARLEEDVVAPHHEELAVGLDDRVGPAVHELMAVPLELETIAP